MAQQRTKLQIHNRFVQLQDMGWQSSEIGKKPLHSYMLEKEGETTIYKSNTLNGLLDKVEHLQPEPAKAA